MVSLSRVFSVSLTYYRGQWTGPIEIDIFAVIGALQEFMVSLNRISLQLISGLRLEPRLSLPSSCFSRLAIITSHAACGPQI